MKINKQKKSEFSERLRNMKFTCGENYVFTFGKYRGRSIRSILDADIDYITWCIAEKILTLDDSTLSLYRAKMHERATREREKARERAEQRREYEARERAEQSAGFDDFFEDFTRKFNRGFRGFGQTERTARDDRPVHPAYAFDNLPMRQKAAKILKLEGQLTKDNIRHKYIETVKQFHPDKYANAPKEIQDFVNEFTKRIISAYEYLKKEYAL